MRVASSSQRIAFLDGLRAVAILSVVGYHYFSRWTTPDNPQNLYPYGGALAPVFHYGYFGVQLFFMISGFVIFMTLYRCSSWHEFLWRRLSRLYPAMLAASVLIFFVARIWSGYLFPMHYINLVPGLTFVELFPWKITPADGAFWSLFVEAKFYVMVAALFWIAGSKNVLGILTLVAVFGNMLGPIAYLAGASGFTLWMIDYALIPLYLPWFIIGLFVYELHTQKRPSRTGLASLTAALLIIAGHAVYNALSGYGSPVVLLVQALTIALFFGAFYLRPLQGLLSASVLVFIGVISYPLYLIHQHIGVSIIHATLGGPLKGPVSLIIPIVIVSGMVTLAWLIYRFVEVPGQRWLRGQTARRRAPVPEPKTVAASGAD